MSLASCSYQCGFIGDDQTFTVSILGATGDLFQRYSGTAASPSSITPNWSGTAQGAGPVLRNILMEGDPNISQADLAGAVVDPETNYYVDGQRIVFGTDGISTNLEGTMNAYAGCFRKLLANKNGSGVPVPTLAIAPFGGLEIRNNLVTASGGKTINITVKLGINTGSVGIHKQGSTNIRIMQSNGNTDFANIYCDAGDSFVLDEDNIEVICKVQCWEGDIEVTTFYRKWYMLEGGNWVQKSTNNTFTVNRGMVATFADIKVECYKDPARTQLIASDVQTINDSSDSLMIVPNPNPADGNFVKGGGIDLTFSPKLTNNNGTPYTNPHTFIYTAFDSVGNKLQSNVNNSGVVTTTIGIGGSFTIDASVADGIGEGPVVNIEAVG